MDDILFAPMIYWTNCNSHNYYNYIKQIASVITIVTLEKKAKCRFAVFMDVELLHHFPKLLTAGSILIRFLSGTHVHYNVFHMALATFPPKTHVSPIWATVHYQYIITLQYLNVSNNVYIKY